MLKKIVIGGLVVSVVAVVSMATYIGITASTPGAKDTEKLYRKTIEESKMFSNDLSTPLPQTAVAEIVRDHFNSALPDGKTQKKAIILGYDGARADGLSTLKNNEFGGTPYLISKGGGTYLSFSGGIENDKATRQNPETAPSWASILTGVWAKDHGASVNYKMKSNDYPTVLTELVEKEIIKKASFHVTWQGHLKDTKDGKGSYMDEMQYVKDKNLDVRFISYEEGVKEQVDMPTVRGLTAELEKADCDDLIFSIIEAPDHAGHGTGYGNWNYKYVTSIQECELASYNLMKTIEARKTYATEDWLIILTSDHGGYGRGHSRQKVETRTTFISSNKNLDKYVEIEKAK